MTQLLIFMSKIWAEFLTVIFFRPKKNLAQIFLTKKHPKNKNFKNNSILKIVC